MADSPVAGLRAARRMSLAVARGALRSSVDEVEASAGGGISVDVEVQDIAVLLHVVRPFEFDVDVPFASTNNGPPNLVGKKTVPF